MSRELELYNKWKDQLGGDQEYEAELNGIFGNDAEIKDRFYRDLEFGTAGLRGVLGLGTNRMNVFTVRRATQGFAVYLKTRADAPSCAIAYDSRIKSDVFAREAACVLAANGVRVYLYKELMPTPALSYAVRELGCTAGIVITASHNPAKYNGYKAYGSDGSQLGPGPASEVMDNMEKVDVFSGVLTEDFEEALAYGRIRYIPDTFVQQYIDRVYDEAIQPQVCAKAGLKLVYTPLNGAGNRCVRAILNKAGITDITVVPEQEKPDGNFPTCPYPNPEMKEALQLGLDLCRKTGADLLLATDPDADRMAVAVREGEDYKILTGNEIGVLLLDYICAAREEKGAMPRNPIAVKSIVSSKLADKVAAEHKVEMISVLTGFKYIGEEILKLEDVGQENRYIFGFEESCGYLTGSYVRDKDAVNASLLFVEMASAYKLEGKTLPQVMEGIYSRHGIHRNVVESVAFEGADGMAKMDAIMERLRKEPPLAIAEDPVVSRTDYKSSIRMENMTPTRLTLPKSNVLEFGLQSGCSIIVRPSGTEPKIKIYYSLVGDSGEQVAAREEVFRQDCAKIFQI